MDDDLPPLCGSDAELSDDLPNLEHSEGEDCAAEAPAAPAPALASSNLPAAGQQRAEGLAGAASAHQQHHGIHLHPHQQHGHHRPQHRGPVSEQRRRMEAGINRNSRLWQVLDAEQDPLAHSLGASPFDERSGPAAHAGGPVLQVVPARARDGSIVLAATNMSVSPSALPGGAHLLSSSLLNSRTSRASNNSSQRSGPLFVQGQDRQRGLFQGLAMPFVTGGQVSLVGPAAAGAAAGAAGAPRAAGNGSLPFMPVFVSGNSSNPNNSSGTAAMAMPMGPPSINTSSRATTAQASFENGHVTLFEAFTNTMANTLAEMQGSSDDGGSPFRSGPRLRARRMRHNATAAAAARAERSATSPGGTPGMFTFGSTPPQAQPAAAQPAAAAVEPAPAAAEAAASASGAAASGTSSRPAATPVAPAAPPAAALAVAPAGSSSSGGTSRAKTRSGSSDAATAAEQAEQQQQQRRQQRGFRWWPPWRILVSGWRLMSWLILGNHSSGQEGSSGSDGGGGPAGSAAGSSNTAAGSAAAAAGDTPPARSTFEVVETAPARTRAASPLFALGPATALSSSSVNSAGSSHGRHGASRRGRRARRNLSSSDEEDEAGYHTISELEMRDANRRLLQQGATTWRFPEVSSTAAAGAAAAAAPGSGGLSGAFSALRQQQQQQEAAPQQPQQQQQGQQQRLEALGPDVDSRPSPSGKRHRAENGEAVDSSRARSPQALPAQGAAAAAAAAGQAGASSSNQQALHPPATATSRTQQQQQRQGGSGAGGTTDASTLPPLLDAQDWQPDSVADPFIDAFLRDCEAQGTVQPAGPGDMSGPGAGLQSGSSAQVRQPLATGPGQAEASAQSGSGTASRPGLERVTILEAARLPLPSPAAAAPPQQPPAAPAAAAARSGQAGGQGAAAPAGQGVQQGQYEESDDESDPDSLPELLADVDGDADSDVSSEADMDRVQYLPVPAQGTHQSSSNTQPAGQQAAPAALAAAPAVAPAAAAAAAVDDDIGSSEMPELLDNMDGGDSDGIPGLGSDSDSSGPPSLGEGSDTSLDDEYSESWPPGDDGDGLPSLRSHSDDVAGDGDGPPDLVSGSGDSDSDSDLDSSSDEMDMDQVVGMPGLTPGFLNAPAPRRPGLQGTGAAAAGAPAGGWEPAGLQAGAHSSGLRTGFLQQGLGGDAAAQSQQQDGDYYSIGDSYYNRQRSANRTSSGLQQQRGASASMEFYNMGDSYYNRSARTAPAAPPAAAAAAAADRDEDSGSEGSWETASDQDLEHARAAQTAAATATTTAAAAGTAGSRIRELYEGSDEEEDDSYDGDSYDEDEEESEEEEEEECGCASCTSMRLINSPAAMRLMGAAAYGIHHSSSSSGQAGVFTRPRSNAFMVPGSSSSNSRTTGGLDSLCGDTSSTSAPRRSGMPVLPPRRGPAGTCQAGLDPAQVPEGCITRAESKARVDGVAGLLSDSAFTQQLLQGLAGVDAGHSSIQAALRVLQGKQYTPVNAAVQLMLPGGVARVMSQGELQRSEADRAARQLIRQWAQAY